MARTRAQAGPRRSPRIKRNQERTQAQPPSHTGRDIQSSSVYGDSKRTFFGNTKCNDPKFPFLIALIRKKITKKIVPKLCHSIVDSTHVEALFYIYSKNVHYA